MRKPVVLVIRQADEFSDILSRRGFEVINLPLISPRRLEDLSELDEKIATLDEYDGLFFTSPIAADIFLAAIGNQRSYRGTIYILGERLKKRFAGTAFEIAHSDTPGTAEDLIRSFDEDEFRGKKFLFVRGDRSVMAIPTLLGDLAVVDAVVVYRTVENAVEVETSRIIREKLDDGEIDWICFFSPSGIDSFMNLFPTKHAKQTKTAAIGNTTAGRAREAGFNLRLVADKANARDFAESLAAYVNNLE